jgi:hypothetical protein
LSLDPGLTVDYLHEGLSIDEPIAELRVVHDDDLEGYEDEKPELEDEDEQVKDERMDVDFGSDMDPNTKSSPSQAVVDMRSRPKLRFPSPDFSWLPPIPDLSAIQPPEPNSPSAATRPRHAVESITVPSAIVDRYRTRIPFASSSLTTQSTYNTPTLTQPTAKRLPPGTTSLPDLISTYADTKGEMSVSIRPNGYRLQALDLLRRQIAAPEGYSPHDSLAVKGSVAGPRFTPIAVPPHPVAVNPDQNGILSRLLHSIQSANLPSELRERLTTLRPPLAQKRDGQPLTYGPGLRGADDAALARAQGKEAQKEDEVYAFATWDSGPRGLEKFSRPNLPRGKKVIKYVEGEEVPRQEKRKASQAPPENVAGTGGLGRTLRIKLGDSVSPAPPGAVPIPSPGLNVAGTGATSSTTPPVITPGGTTLKLKIKRDSLDVPNPSTDATNGNTTGTPRHSPRNTISPLPTTSLIPQPTIGIEQPPASIAGAQNTSLPLPTNGTGPRHSPRHTTSELPALPSPNSLPPSDNGNGDSNGLPPPSLRQNHSPAPGAGTSSPHTQADPGLPHRSARLSISPLNPTVALPDIKPSTTGMKSPNPSESNLTAVDGHEVAQLEAKPEVQKNGTTELHPSTSIELYPSTSPTLSPSSDKLARPKDA